MLGTSLTARRLAAVILMVGAGALAGTACTTSTADPMVTVSAADSASAAPTATASRPITGRATPIAAPHPTVTAAGGGPTVSLAALPDPGIDPTTGSSYPNLLAAGGATGAGLIEVPPPGARVRTVTVRWACFGTGSFSATEGDSTLPLTRTGCDHSVGFSYSADIPVRLLRGHELMLHLPAHSETRYAVTTD